ncbi:MAG: hypothetical protein GY862_35430 [Gammaproteobacteria bacterium]|nr:hypothetical protein [Gammaproteobacteria bacterium]
MKMNSHWRHWSAGAIVLCSAAVHAAEDAFLIPKAFISSRHFEYSAGPTKISSRINSLGVALTSTRKKFYADLSAEKNLSPGKGTENIEFDRKDGALSCGYSMNESIRVFAGFKYGKTSLSESVSLKGQGPFIGAGGGWRVRDLGVFSFSAAYAALDAAYRTSSDTSSGKASGTSLSVAWKGAITEKLYYDFSLIRHDYFYEGFKNLEFEITEDMLSFRIGLSYRFW